MPKRYIGAHVSAQGGMQKTVGRAILIGANTMQIFGTSPYSWAAAKHSESDIAEFKKAMRAAHMGPVFLHAPYIINLASPDPVLRKRSEMSLAANLKIAEAIGAAGVIFHIGSSKGGDKAAGRRQVAASVRGILQSVSGKSRLLLENSAGGGDSVGSALVDIGEILKAIGSPRAGFCFDTAHAFEAGIIESYSEEGVALLAKEIRKHIGAKGLRAVHANDSKTAFDSHHDRHENIGEGHIGKEGFRNLLLDPLFSGVPWILEVPGFSGQGPDKRNLDILLGLL